MARPLVLIHGYSATGLDFSKLSAALTAKNIAAVDINIANYVSLNNEITIKDIAEGLARAFRNKPELNDGQEFDAIVHSTGILVIRSWLTNYGAAVESNSRLKRLKHLIGLAPATWGSPQAHKGRTWLGALVKGNRNVGPDFMDAGDEVLDGLELGSKFTWDLAERDLLGDQPYYGKGAGTPYVCVFIGNTPYEGISSVANDPGTDGTVRWAGCGLNARKVVVDLTRMPTLSDGSPAASRISMTPWADDRLDIPMIPVAGKNHATLISDPDDAMVQLVADFLKIDNETTYDAWNQRAQEFGTEARMKMCINPGKDAAGIGGDVQRFFGHLFPSSERVMEGWQQFVVHARDERGDGVSDYLIDVLREDENGKWVPFEEMYTDVHAYKTDLSYRCFHIRLVDGISRVPLKLQIHASTGTKLMAYQGYGSEYNGSDHGQSMTAESEPIVLDLDGTGAESIFQPFTTTMVEIVLNREPLPMNGASDIFKFL